MYSLDITDNEQELLFGRYKGLSVTQENDVKVVSGDFKFTAIPTKTGIKLSDTYQLKIELRPTIYSNIPAVFETGGRIIEISRRRNIPLADLHTYSNGMACLCLKLDEKLFFPNDFSFLTFIEKLVVPFYYSQKYFEEYFVWPWEDYSHGYLGWLEWYSDHSPHIVISTIEFLLQYRTMYGKPFFIKELTSKESPKGHQPCLCRSGISYRDCHPKVFQGLWNLRNDILSNKILLSKFGW